MSEENLERNSSPPVVVKGISSMLRSIRWQLQLWHAAILALAVAGIGLASFFAIQQARYREIDSELEAAAQVLLAKLRGPSRPPGIDRRPFDNGGPGARDGRRDPGGFDGPDGFGGDFGPGDGPGGPPRAFDEFDPQRPLPRPDRLPRTIDLPNGFLQRYGASELDARSFVIYRTDYTVIRHWGATFDPKNLPPASLRPSGDAVTLHTRGEMHEVLLAAPEDSIVLVTGSVQRVDNELHALIWQLVVAAGGVLVIGLLGGSLISHLAIRPIGRMSEMAGAISPTKLNSRIDARIVPSELRQLAMVLNAAFDRLEIAFDQQARFTADASHELRTPLAVILSHSELALSRGRSPEEYRKTIETIFSASMRMKSLVESLLLLSHADVGELSLQPVPMDLSDVVRDNVDLLLTLAGRRSITVATHLQNATLVGDPPRISQVVANLLSNAIRYNRDGGSIAVSTEIILGESVLTVADTGTGISTEDQQQVFTRFFRADKARSREAGGSGLGLAICKSIVEAHGGSIEVQSEPGVGTTFTVRLPRGSAETTMPLLPEKIEL
jgi:two-component system OmpR family sensor kinase